MHAERISYQRTLLVLVRGYTVRHCANMLLNLLPVMQLIWCITAAPQSKVFNKEKIDNSLSLQQIGLKSDDLKTAASSYSHQYSNWGGNSPGGYEYSVTGYGLINDKHGLDYGVGGYGSTFKNIGYPGYTNTGSISNTEYNDDAWINGYTGYNGYKSNGEYNPNVFGGNGGYGGYGGNGGLNSYSGYNNPYYQGSNHLGYGYYNKQPGFGNIYNSGITPSLVTGYRGYTRR